MNRKNFFASLVMLAALASAGFAQTPSQDCPNRITFGSIVAGPAEHSVQAEVEITYFTTDDPNAFISERAGLDRSPTFVRLNTNEFVARLEGLQREGLASTQMRQSLTSQLGELAQVQLVRGAINLNGGMIKAGLPGAKPSQVYDVERETQVSVSRNPATDGDAYRIATLSWIVDATRERGGFKMVDDDSSVLLKPGQTALIKLISDAEVKRSGPARKYMAVTLRSVGRVGLASAKN